MSSNRKEKIVKFLIELFSEAIINSVESGKTVFVDFFKEKDSFSLYADDLGISVSKTPKNRVKLTITLHGDELSFYFPSKSELEKIFKETNFYKVINAVLSKAKSVERQIIDGTIFEHYEF